MTTVRFLCLFHGRKAGAIGETRPCRMFVNVPDVPEPQVIAREECYKTHEHISDFRCREAEARDEK